MHTFAAGLSTGGVVLYEVDDDYSKAQMAHTVQIEGGEPKCSCTAFKFRRECAHVNLVRPHLSAETGAFVWTEGVGTSTKHWHPVDGHVELCQYDVGIVTASWARLLPPAPAERHLYELMSTLRGTPPGREETAGDDATGTHRRYYEELGVAFNRALPFTAEEVTGTVCEHLPEWTTLERLSGTFEPTGDVASSGAGGAIVSAAGRPAWKTVPPPAGFSVDREVWECLLYCATHGHHAILTGPTGSGKSEIVYHVARGAGVDIEPLNFGAMSEARTSLIGATHFDRDAGTWMQKSRFVRALEKTSGIILCDELTRAPIDAFNLILPAMDTQGYVALDEAEDAALVYRGDAVSFMATANVGMEYTGTEALDRALLDRFAVKIDLDYPVASEEVRIATARFPKAPAAFVKSLVDAAQSQRTLAKSGEMITAISTRMILDCVRMVSDGFDARAAVRFAILNCFTADGGDASERAKAATQLRRVRLV